MDTGKTQSDVEETYILDSFFIEGSLNAAKTMRILENDLIYTRHTLPESKKPFTSDHPMFYQVNTPPH